MRIVLQRVSSASVRVDAETVGEISAGLLILVAVSPDDGLAEVQRLARKCAEMRIFPDNEGRFELSLLDTSGEALVVSQFTLLADVRKGRRPAFTAAAPPQQAEPLVVAFADALRTFGVRVATGRFGAQMQVKSVNDGPVTIIVDSADLNRPRHG